jgi:hypothetical protein
MVQRIQQQHHKQLSDPSVKLFLQGFPTLKTKKKDFLVFSFFGY